MASPSHSSSKGKGRGPKTRKSLLARLKNWQDQDSWREFFAMYETVIFDTARKAGLNDTESQEVVQETLLSVAKRIAGFDYDPKAGSFKGWLLTITRRRIVDHLRKRERTPGDRPGHLEARALENVTDPNAARLESIWNEEWHQALLDMARTLVKKRVGKRQYEMFELYAIRQVPMKTVTQMLHVNAAQVYMAKYRVSRLLKKEIQKLQDQADAEPTETPPSLKDSMPKRSSTSP